MLFSYFDLLFAAVEISILSTFELVQFSDEYFMQRAFQLAEKGKFTTAPNPKVGAVIVYNNQIIGEGYHQAFGKAHAEANAIQSVANKDLLPKATLFVSLEPCAHFGKTPPCAELLVKHGIKNVIISNQDPFEKVDGSGISILQKAGIKVKIGCLEREGKKLNRRFFSFHSKKRPYVILKWAVTEDGFIGREKGSLENSWITNSLSKQLVHLWRAEEAAILVGKNTVLQDNPELTCREVFGKNPCRIIIDESLEIPKSFKIYNSKAKTIIINSEANQQIKNCHFIKVESRENLAKNICNIAFSEGLNSIIIEGGSSILKQFILSGIWDEARVFKTKKTFNKGVKAPLIRGKIITKKVLKEDELVIYTNPNS